MGLPTAPVSHLCRAKERVKLLSGIQQRVPEARSRAVKGECGLGVVKNKASETSVVRSVKIEPHSLVRKTAQGEQVRHLMGMPRISFCHN